MGFVRDRAAEGLWMTLNGGAMQMSTTLPEGTNDPLFSDTAIKSGGYGIIDVAWKARNSCVPRVSGAVASICTEACTLVPGTLVPGTAVRCHSEY